MPQRELSESVDFDLLDEHLGCDLRAALEESVAGGVILEGGTTALEIFRSAVAAAIRDIREHPRGSLLVRFLVDGPYEGEGDIPPDLAAKRLTDDETARAIAFVYSSMVNAFQGRLAELFAARPVLGLLRDLKERGDVGSDAVLFVGDVVTAPQSERNRRDRAADLHVLTLGVDAAVVAAIGEVKSYAAGSARLRAQLAKHVARCRRGLVIGGQTFAAHQVSLARDPPILVSIRPSDWCLPREFRFEDRDGGSFLHMKPYDPPAGPDECRLEADGIWHVRLRWSHEALAAAAYGLTFWYMERVGEVAFSEPSRCPWPEMTPAEAGCNAAKQSLYYAILRRRKRSESNRAIALYNMYGFGYALGMNYRDANGRREMLWPQDLREILVNGYSRSGCRIHD